MILSFLGICVISVTSVNTKRQSFRVHEKRATRKIREQIQKITQVIISLSTVTEIQPKQ